MKFNKSKQKQLLQQYVDFKLNSMRVDCDDLSDYISNYTDDEHLIIRKNTNLLNKWNVTPEEFLEDFNPSETEVRNAIKKSPLLDVLAKRFTQAVIKTVPQDIVMNIIDQDKNMAEDIIEHDYEEEDLKPIIQKLKKALTKEELYLLKKEGVFYDNQNR